MKKRYLAIGVLATFQCFGQAPENTYSRQQLKKTDVQLLLTYYTQDNERSAVTGGLGTEDLQVYGTSISISHEKDSLQTYQLTGGVDLITSASTDNIDFVMSSASRTDFRAYATFGYTKRIRGSPFTFGASAAFSMESDYLSIGPGLSIYHTNDDKGRNWFLQVQTYFDDLRWIHNGHHEGLIYPVELRTRDWFDVYRRNSYTVSAGLYQVINRRMNVTVYPGIAYQHGLLSTPFHRVYFTDGSLRVENLNDQRLKIPLAVQWNSFIGTQTILKLYYRYYWDTFGIRAHTLNVESPIKLSRVTTLIPFMRFYTQSAADHFQPYGEHETEQDFYTSDYDLSAFDSYKPGLGVRVAPYVKKHSVTFKALEFRYALYRRSDGLTAHMFSLLTDWSWERKARLE